MITRTYLRDGRAPVPRDARTSEVMSRIRAKNTKPERDLRELLSARGFRGYRLHYAAVAGRPDIAFVSRRVAVFVHGCFWHGCPYCQQRTPKSNRAWWRKKIGANQARDRKKAAALRRAGWSVVTIRECRLKKAPAVQAEKVARALARRA